MRVNVLAGLTNGEWDHDSCEATVSTKDADHATIMREQLMGYRKQRFAALFCAAAVIMLGGCGDDLTQQVYIPGREDLAQPIGGYNATTQEMCIRDSNRIPGCISSNCPISACLITPSSVMTASTQDLM